MADWLLLRLPRAPEQPASWLIVDSRGAPSGPPQTGPLSVAAARAAGRRICVLVPGTDVLLSEPEIPAKAGAKLHQLVPFAMEEQLADDIDTLHFAIGKRVDESPRVRVAVIARSLMDSWLTNLRANGLEPEAMYPDSELVPQNPGQAVALLEEDAVVVRPPSGSPVTLPIDALYDALQIAQSSNEENAPPTRGLILYTGAAEWQQHSPQVEAFRERFDGIKIQLLTGGPLALFGQQLPTANPINLLQGSYTPTTSRTVGWRAWRVAATLLVALVGLHVAGKAAELTMLKRSEHKLDTSIRETFQSAMPGETTTADPRRQMEQRLGAARGGGGSAGLLPALEALAQARSAAPGAQLQSLNFHNGLLELKMAAPDAASLDRLSKTLTTNGWQTDLTGGNSVTSGGYEGRLQVRANGP